MVKALFKCLSDYNVNKSDRDEYRQIIRSFVFSSSQGMKDGDRNLSKSFGELLGATGAAAKQCGLFLNVTGGSLCKHHQ